MPLITITQGLGCEGLSVAQKVADKLKVELYDDVSLRSAAKAMTSKSGKVIHEFKEESPSWYIRLMGHPEVYLNLMESAIFEIASRGEGIIIGLGSQVLLQDFGCALHVLVTAGEDKRIENAMHQFKISEDDARKLIRQSDKQNTEFFSYAFHRNWTEPSLYDLCINPGKMGIDRSVELVIATAQYPEMQACSLNAKDALERISQIKRIETYLFELDMRPLGLKVTIPQKGIVHIEGIIIDPGDRIRLEEAARSIPGIKDVKVGFSLGKKGRV